jgi:hypothetical protein
MSEEHITDLKKISLTLRDINKRWTEHGNQYKLVEEIIELDTKIYKKIKSIEMMKGCGQRYPIKGSEDCFPSVGAVCGDNAFFKEGDEPNLCEECKIKFAEDKDGEQK